MKIIGIMACDTQGLIGQAESLPWHYPEDLIHFHQYTHNHTMIMGRKTFDGLPENMLSNKSSIVFSREPSLVRQENIFFVHDWPQCCALINSWQDEKYYMIGGAEIARFFLQKNLLDEFILTRIKKKHVGNIFLPELLTIHWPYKIIKDTSDFSIYHYRVK